jgi:hypothetical protein
MNAPKDIQDSYAAWVAANTPPGTLIVIEGPSVRVVCNGEAFHRRCGYDPGHRGACRTMRRAEDFTPLRGGPGEAVDEETAYLCLECRKVTEDYAGDPSTGGLGSLCCNAKVELITLTAFDRQIAGRSLRSPGGEDTLIRHYLSTHTEEVLNEVTLDDFRNLTLDDFSCLTTLMEDLERHHPYKLMLREQDRRKDWNDHHPLGYRIFDASIIYRASEIWCEGVLYKSAKGETS